MWDIPYRQRALMVELTGARKHVRVERLVSPPIVKNDVYFKRRGINYFDNAVLKSKI